MSIFEDQKEFMLAGGQSVDKVAYDQLNLYEELINEEYQEFIESNKEWDSEGGGGMAETVKESVDLIVVLIGRLLSLGIEPQKAWNLVHENNLAKVYEATIKDENGKIMKSPESKARKEEMMNNIRTLCYDALVLNKG